jgi:HK97 family phage major capsid protein
MTVAAKEKLGTMLEELYRDFEIVEMVPVAKKVFTPAEVEARAQRAERRKKREAAKEPPDPDDDEDDDAAADEERFAITISSEFPVERWFGTEILDHSPEAVDLSRAKLGLSFLDSHDAKSVIGVVDRVKVEDKKLRGQVQFSRSLQAQQIKRDVQDRIRRFISVGYRINEYVLTKSSKDEGDTYRATKWTPLEASSVGVPADPTAGHDRKAGARQYPVLVRSANHPASEPNPKEVKVPETKELTASEHRAAAAEIFRLGRLHKIDEARTEKAVADGMSIADYSALVLEEVAKRGAKPLTQPPSEGADRIELTDKEQRNYNLARGIMTAALNIESGGSRKVRCFEMEISDDIEKNWKGERHGGLYVPFSIRHAWTPELEKKFPNQITTRAGLDSATATAGAELKFTEPGEFLKFMYNQMRVKQLGARSVSGLRDNVSYPKQTGKATGSWVGENPGTDVADSALTLGSILSSPHTYQSSTSYSRQLLAQAQAIDVDTLVREDLARDQALAVDSVALIGGGTNQPNGIAATTGVQAYVMIADVANGGLPSWDDVVLMSELLEDANVDQLGSGAWLTTPGVKSRLKRTAQLGNTIGLPIWANDNTVDGYPAASSNQLKKNTTKGTSGATLHTMIRGIFETMIISQWGSGFELVVDPYRLKKQGMIELTSFMLIDVTLTYPPAFVLATDVIK